MRHDQPCEQAPGCSKQDNVWLRFLPWTKCGGCQLVPLENVREPGFSLPKDLG